MKKVLLSAILCLSGLLAVETNISEKKTEIKDLFEKTNNKVENNKVENNKVENNKVENNKVENNKVENNKVENNKVENNTNVLSEQIKEKEKKIQTLLISINKETDALKKREIANEIKKERDEIYKLTNPNGNPNLNNNPNPNLNLNANPSQNANQNSNSNIEEQIKILSKTVEDMKKSNASYENLEKVMLKGNSLSEKKEENNNTLEMDNKITEETKEEQEKNLLPIPIKIAIVGSQKILFATYKEESYDIETESKKYEEKTIKIKEGFTKGKWILSKINMDVIIYTNKETNEEILKYIDKTKSEQTEIKKVTSYTQPNTNIIKKPEEKKVQKVQKKIETNSNKNNSSSRNNRNSTNIN